MTGDAAGRGFDAAAGNLNDQLNRLERALIDVERAFYGVNAAAEMFTESVRYLTGVTGDDEARPNAQ